ncbi:hypothetical protein EI94DRAFT_1795013 [Lactarius quietus]|nr:hypothetical protein EI94DRAFT_1795013 [Lactarius quietus]
MDGFGIVYLIDNAQQFWSELEDILKIPGNASLSLLDATLKRSIAFSASYHEQYLQSPLQLEHACNLIFDSELFAFHSERMCEILTDEAAVNTDPHTQFILFSTLLLYGRRNPGFLRSCKRWEPLFPLLMDHVLADLDPDIEDTFSGSTSASGPSTVCRSSKLSVAELKVFDDSFLDKLFDLVEQTRSMHDETFNYSVIKLIVHLIERAIMVAELSSKPHNGLTNVTNSQNRVLHVLIRRHGTSQTFGENMIFMLNRAGRAPEDLVMQLLVLKMLYILFNTKGLSEYFYTNDLCVLVDVFLREIVDLDEESESLRHTFLRVLHPLLTKTQLRSLPYKRPHIVRALESLVAYQDIRDVSSTTKRLVDRCLSGECRSAETLRGLAAISAKPASRGLETLRKPTNDSSLQLATASPPPSATTHRNLHRHWDRTGSETLPNPPNSREVTSPPATALSPGGALAVPPAQSQQLSPVSMHSFDGRSPPPSPADSAMSSTSTASGTKKVKRRSPPAPPKRRKPPAVPKRVGVTNSGAEIAAIASSTSAPALGKVGKI